MSHLSPRNGPRSGGRGRLDRIRILAVRLGSVALLAWISVTTGSGFPH
jgi:hypothetical protein